MWLKIAKAAGAAALTLALAPVLAAVVSYGWHVGKVGATVKESLTVQSEMWAFLGLDKLGSKAGVETFREAQPTINRLVDELAAFREMAETNDIVIGLRPKQ